MKYSILYFSALHYKQFITAEFLCKNTMQTIVFNKFYYYICTNNLSPRAKTHKIDC